MENKLRALCFETEHPRQGDSIECDNDAEFIYKSPGILVQARERKHFQVPAALRMASPGCLDDSAYPAHPLQVAASNVAPPGALHGDSRGQRAREGAPRDGRAPGGLQLRGSCALAEEGSPLHRAPPNCLRPRCMAAHVRMQPAPKFEFKFELEKRSGSPSEI